MNFAYPAFLAALAAIAIPIIVHLFNFRRFKTVYFSDIRFLRQVKIEKQTKNKLKHFAVLACRILAISALVLAFAYPFLKNNQSANQGLKHAVSIFYDNSFSMEQVNETGMLLDEASIKASQISKAYGPADRFQLLTNDFEPRHQHFLNRDDFQNILGEVKLSPAFQDIQKILKRQSEALAIEGNTQKEIFIVSDFQKNMYPASLKGIDSTARIFLVPLKGNTSPNLYIDTCYLSSPMIRPNGEAILNFKIVNNSSDARESVPVKLTVNGVQKALTSVSVGAGQATIAQLKFRVDKAGFYSSVLKITDFPVVYDDEFFFSFQVFAQTKVLCLFEGSEPKPIKNLFSNDPEIKFNLEQISAFKYEELANNNFIILNGLSSISSGLNQELVSFAKNGKSVLVIPSENPDLVSYNQLLTDLGLPIIAAKDTTRGKIKTIEFQSNIFKNVFSSKEVNTDLPIIFTHFITTNSTPSEKLLTLANGDVFLQKSTSVDAFLLAATLTEKAGNFAKHALMVPTLYNMALFSLPQSQLYQEITENNTFEFAPPELKTETSLRIVDATGQEFIPGQSFESNKIAISLHGQIRNAGNYYAMNGKDTLAGISLNFNRKESELNFLDKDALTSLMEKSGIKNFEVFDANSPNIGSQVLDLQQGNNLWKWFVLAALVFLLIELVLLRFWKV